jgi:hypothetical protein
VAHDALFREWARLEGWLEPQRARLEALRALQVDALSWDRNGRDAAFLNHRNRRLAEVVMLARLETYRRRLGELERDYIIACQGADRSQRKRTQRVKALVGALAFGIIAGLIGWMNQSYLQERWGRRMPFET